MARRPDFGSHHPQGIAKSCAGSAVLHVGHMGSIRLAVLPAYEPAQAIPTYPQQRTQPTRARARAPSCCLSEFGENELMKDGVPADPCAMATRRSPVLLTLLGKGVGIWKAWGSDLLLQVPTYSPRYSRPAVWRQAASIRLMRTSDGRRVSIVFRAPPRNAAKY